MKRSESQFCRDEAKRLRKLAKDCADKKVRDHLTEMAHNWLMRADEKERIGKKTRRLKTTHS